MIEIHHIINNLTANVIDFHSTNPYLKKRLDITADAVRNLETFTSFFCYTLYPYIILYLEINRN